MFREIILKLLVITSIVGFSESLDEAQFVNIVGYHLEFETSSSFSARNKLVCARACRNNPDCMSYNFDAMETELDCELFFLALNETAILREDRNSEFSCKFSYFLNFDKSFVLNLHYLHLNNISAGYFVIYYIHFISLQTF